MNGSGRHYEMAFEDFLAAEGVAYVPVSGTQRQAFRLASLKSFDFVVWPAQGPNWLVDVKGRQSRTGRLENWVTTADLEGLARWQQVFGAGFVGMFVFAYLIGDPSKWSHQQAPLHDYADKYYSFWAITVEDFNRLAKRRSARWKTCSVPAGRFKEVARPVAEWLAG